MSLSSAKNQSLASNILCSMHLFWSRGGWNIDLLAWGSPVECSIRVKASSALDLVYFYITGKSAEAMPDFSNAYVFNKLCTCWWWLQVVI